MKHDNLETFVPLVLRRRGVRRVADDERDAHDVALIEGLARAFYWQQLLDADALPSGSAVARAEKLHHSVVNELLRLTLLAPDLSEQVMAGRPPRRLTLTWFQRNPLPVYWQVQRELFTSFEGAHESQASRTHPGGSCDQRADGAGRRSPAGNVRLLDLREAGLPQAGHHPAGRAGTAR